MSVTSCMFLLSTQGKVHFAAHKKSCTYKNTNSQSVKYQHRAAGCLCFVCCHRNRAQCLRGLTNLPELSSLTVFSSVGSTSTVFSTRLWCSDPSLDLKPQGTGSCESRATRLKGCCSRKLRMSNDKLHEWDVYRCALQILTVSSCPPFSWL